MCSTAQDKKSVVPGKQQLNSELLEDILELKDSDEEAECNTGFSTPAASGLLQ